MEKISFLYVSPVVPGKAVHHLHMPEPWMALESLPSTEIIDITFGLILKMNKPYKLEIDVFFNEISLLPKDRDIISNDPVVSLANSDNDYVSIENMCLKDVNITNYGVHKVVATLHATDGEVNENNICARYESYFFVSNGWLK